jgi:hypothetical protein
VTRVAEMDAEGDVEELGLSNSGRSAVPACMQVLNLDLQEDEEIKYMSSVFGETNSIYKLR